MSTSKRGLIGRIWETVCSLLLNSNDVKAKTDQFQFVDGKLRTTGEDGGGAGNLQPVIDELIELNGKVALDDTLDLVATEATLELIRQLTFSIKSQTDKLTFDVDQLKVTGNGGGSGLNQGVQDEINLNTNRIENLLVNLVKEQQKTNKILDKIYKPY